MNLAIILSVFIVFTISNEYAEAQNCKRVCDFSEKVPYKAVCDNYGNGYDSPKELECAKCRAPGKGISLVSYGSNCSLRK
ncbi:unnamed protein product [Allacma fusca]|uniref:Uncharacterized protein n=1 Tax=Allacma fusca TaxID=39272 RepID=A0A8J2K6E5_9HEXA|nr:unnamed protein product [Allacma fusca]